VLLLRRRLNYFRNGRFGFYFLVRDLVGCFGGGFQFGVDVPSGSFELAVLAAEPALSHMLGG